MATATKTTQATEAAEAAEAKAPQYSIGALFATSSTTFPFVGKVDKALLEKLNATAPEGQEYKLFVKAKVSKSGKPYLSIYMGPSDIDR
jgi:hypothetical protein